MSTLRSGRKEIFEYYKIFADTTKELRAIEEMLVRLLQTIKDRYLNLLTLRKWLPQELNYFFENPNAVYVKTTEFVP